ncbi:response regulator, partial [candidate division GN15 bacterium]|nr:response regulator [candidate division GN15 bacterium]
MGCSPLKAITRDLFLNNALPADDHRQRSSDRMNVFRLERKPMSREPKKRILVVDDEEYICRIIVESLAGENYTVTAFSNPSDALAHIAANPVDLVLTDLVMGEFSGLQILEAALTNHPDAIVILMTAHPTVQTAISVLKRGAYDFLVKPFKLELLNATIKRGLGHQRILRDNLSLKGQIDFLKVANAYFGTELDLSKYLELVLASCNTELSASASAVMEIDPESGNVIRRVHTPGDPVNTVAVLDDSLLDHFRGTKQLLPVITSERMEVDGRRMYRILIASPIFIHGIFRGLINVLIDSRYESIPQGKLDVLQLLCSSAASAMANHKLYRDLEKSYLQAFRALANAIEA